MENQITTAKLIEELASRNRVLMLGGLAVISHGLSRITYDGDTWLDSNLTPEAWSKRVFELVSLHERLQVVSMGDWQPVSLQDLPEVIENDGVIRITGVSQPLDIFRKPNEFEIGSFDEVWERAKPLEDGTRLPDVIDLLLTKQDTGRDKDNYDIAFLEGLATNHYLQALPIASKEEALKMLGRFLTPKIAALAMQHAEPDVREAGRGFLVELAEAGDPYAADLMRQMSQS